MNPMTALPDFLGGTASGGAFNAQVRRAADPNAPIAHRVGAGLGAALMAPTMPALATAERFGQGIGQAFPHVMDAVRGAIGLNAMSSASTPAPVRTPLRQGQMGRTADGALVALSPSGQMMDFAALGQKAMGDVAAVQAMTPAARQAMDQAAVMRAMQARMDAGAARGAADRASGGVDNRPMAARMGEAKLATMQPDPAATAGNRLIGMTDSDYARMTREMAAGTLSKEHAALARQRITEILMAIRGSQMGQTMSLAPGGMVGR